MSEFLREFIGGVWQATKESLVPLEPVNHKTGHHLGMVPESWIGMNHWYEIIPTTEILALTPNGNIYMIYFFLVLLKSPFRKTAAFKLRLLRSY